MNFSFLIFSNPLSFYIFYSKIDFYNLSFYSIIDKFKRFIFRFFSFFIGFLNTTLFYKFFSFYFNLFFKINGLRFVAEWERLIFINFINKQEEPIDNVFYLALEDYFKSFFIYKYFLNLKSEDFYFRYYNFALNSLEDSFESIFKKFSTTFVFSSINLKPDFYKEFLNRYLKKSFEFDSNFVGFLNSKKDSLDDKNLDKILSSKLNLSNFLASYTENLMFELEMFFFDFIFKKSRNFYLEKFVLLSLKVIHDFRFFLDQRYFTSFSNIQFPLKNWLISGLIKGNVKLFDRNVNYNHFFINEANLVYFYKLNIFNNVFKNKYFNAVFYFIFLAPFFISFYFSFFIVIILLEYLKFIIYKVFDKVLYFFFYMLVPFLNFFIFFINLLFSLLIYTYYLFFKLGYFFIYFCCSILKSFVNPYYILFFSNNYYCYLFNRKVLLNKKFSFYGFEKINFNVIFNKWCFFYPSLDRAKNFIFLKNFCFRFIVNNFFLLFNIIFDIFSNFLTFLFRIKYVYDSGVTCFFKMKNIFYFLLEITKTNLLKIYNFLDVRNCYLNLLKKRFPYNYAFYWSSKNYKRLKYGRVRKIYISFSFKSIFSNLFRVFYMVFLSLPLAVLKFCWVRKILFFFVSFFLYFWKILIFYLLCFVFWLFDFFNEFAEFQFLFKLFEDIQIDEQYFVIVLLLDFLPRVLFIIIFFLINFLIFFFKCFVIFFLFLSDYFSLVDSSNVDYIKSFFLLNTLFHGLDLLFAVSECSDFIVNFRFYNDLNLRSLMSLLLGFIFSFLGLIFSPISLFHFYLKIKFLDNLGSEFFFYGLSNWFFFIKVKILFIIISDFIYYYIRFYFIDVIIIFFSFFGDFFSVFLSSIFLFFLSIFFFLPYFFFSFFDVLMFVPFGLIMHFYPVISIFVNLLEFYLHFDLSYVFLDFVNLFEFKVSKIIVLILKCWLYYMFFFFWFLFYFISNFHFIHILIFTLIDDFIKYLNLDYVGSFQFASSEAVLVEARFANAWCETVYINNPNSTADYPLNYTHFIAPNWLVGILMYYIFLILVLTITKFKDYVYNWPYISDIRYKNVLDWFLYGYRPWLLRDGLSSFSYSELKTVDSEISDLTIFELQSYNKIISSKFSGLTLLDIFDPIWFNFFLLTPKFQSFENFNFFNEMWMLKARIILLNRYNYDLYVSREYDRISYPLLGQYLPLDITKGYLMLDEDEYSGNWLTWPDYYLFFPIVNTTFESWKAIAFDDSLNCIKEINNKNSDFVDKIENEIVERLETYLQAKQEWLLLTKYEQDFKNYIKSLIAFQDFYYSNQDKCSPDGFLDRYRDGLILLSDVQKSNSLELELSAENLRKAWKGFFALKNSVESKVINSTHKNFDKMLRKFDIPLYQSKGLKNVALSWFIKLFAGSFLLWVHAVLDRDFSFLGKPIYGTYRYFMRILSGLHTRQYNTVPVGLKIRIRASRLVKGKHIIEYSYSDYCDFLNRWGFPLRFLKGRWFKEVVFPQMRDFVVTYYTGYYWGYYWRLARKVVKRIYRWLIYRDVELFSSLEKKRSAEEIKELGKHRFKAKSKKLYGKLNEPYERDKVLKEVGNELDYGIKSEEKTVFETSFYKRFKEIIKELNSDDD